MTLSWHSASEASIAGHKIVYGFQSGQYPYVIDVGNVTQATVTLPDWDGDYFLAVVAYTHNWIDSAPSEEVIFAPPRPPRIALTRQPGGELLISWNSVPGTGYRVLHKPRLEDQTWTPVTGVMIAESPIMEWSTTMDPSARSGFFTVQVFANPIAPPQMAMTLIEGTSLKLSWACVPGVGYRVMYKRALRDPEWVPVSGVLTSETTTLEWMTQVDRSAPSGFYMLQVIPDPEAKPAARLSMGTNQQLRLAWTAVPDRRYQVFYKRFLTDTEWTPISQVLTAGDVSLEWTAPIDPDAPSGFFKVELLPEG